MSSYATSQLTFCVLDITARIALTDLHRVDGLRARRLAARRRMLVLHRHLGARHGRHQRDGFGSGGDGTGGFEGEGLFVFARSVVFSQLLHDRALHGQHQGNSFSLRWFAQQTSHVHVRHISKGNLRRGHPPERAHEGGGLPAASRGLRSRACTSSTVVFAQFLHDRALRGQHQGNRFSLRWFAQQTLHVHVRHISKGNLRRGHPPEWTHEWGGLLAALSRVRHVRELSAPRMIIRDC